MSSRRESITEECEKYSSGEMKAKGHDTFSQQSAENEYKNAIESLKHPNRVYVSENSSEEFQKRRSGFLKPDEVGDDWLEDDLGPDKKKRKYLTDRTVFGNSNKTPEQTIEYDKTSRESVDLVQMGDDSSDAFQILLESSNKYSSTRKTKMSKRSNRRNRSQIKHQSSLLDKGFCRFWSESPSPNEDSSEDKTTEPDSTTATVQNTDFKNELSATLTQPVSATVSFKIKVEGELLLVPVDRRKVPEVNIRWLAEEASRRYYNRVGLRPVLRLMTPDGFAFEEDDMLGAALEQNMISSEVLEWKISQLAQRYEEMCNQLHLDPNHHIKLILEKAQASNCVSLADLFLSITQATPVFRAMLHQTTLRILDLSNNFIQNKGCRLLGKSLSTLKQLTILNLSGNYISSEGLNSLAEEISSSEILELEELNLSFNPLGNESMRSLDKLCKCFQKMKKLNISSCNITSFYSYDFNFHNLTNIDVSFNSLSNESLYFLLDKLNSCRLVNLNLSFAINDKSAGNKICQCFESGTCEKFKTVRLAGCNLSDFDIYKLVQLLLKAKDMEFLDLQENQKLTFVSFQYILKYLSQLKKLLLSQCLQICSPKIIESLHLDSTDKIPEFISLTLKENDDETGEVLRRFWEERYDEGRIHFVGRNIYLYINKCDLLDG